jgi:TRAP-type C4-dicarboxylate transport system permease small subunit
MRRTLERVESGLGYLAQVALAFMMFVVAADVIGRYVFRAPVPWAEEVTTIYLMPAVFFLGMPNSLSGRAHIAVDILYRNMTDWLKWVCGLISLVAVLLFVASLCYVGSDRTLEAYRSGETVVGWIAWPTWIANAMVPVACLLMTLRTLIHIVMHFLGGQDARPANEMEVSEIGVE